MKTHSSVLIKNIKEKRDHLLSVYSKEILKKLNISTSEFLNRNLAFIECPENTVITEFETPKLSKTTLRLIEPTKNGYTEELILFEIIIDFNSQKNALCNYNLYFTYPSKYHYSYSNTPAFFPTLPTFGRSFLFCPECFYLLSETQKFLPSYQILALLF